MSGARLRRSEVFTELASLGAYPDGWDGAGSLALSPQAYTTCESVLAQLQEPIPQPELTLNENGTLTFEWYEEPYIYLEVGTMTFSMLIRDEGGNQYVNDSVPNLHAVIQNLLIPKLIGTKDA